MGYFRSVARIAAGQGDVLLISTRASGFHSQANGNDHVTVLQRYRRDCLAASGLRQQLGEHQSCPRGSHARAEPLQDRSRYRQVHREDHARRHGGLRRRLAPVHAVAGLLARLHRSAEDDRRQEALRQHQAPLPLPVRLDGRGAALRVRSAARPVDAREDRRCRR